MSPFKIFTAYSCSNADNDDINVYSRPWLTPSWISSTLYPYKQAVINLRFIECERIDFAKIKLFYINMKTIFSCVLFFSWRER